MGETDFQNNRKKVMLIIEDGEFSAFSTGITLNMLEKYDFGFIKKELDRPFNSEILSDYMSKHPEYDAALFCSFCTGDLVEPVKKAGYKGKIIVMEDPFTEDLTYRNYTDSRFPYDFGFVENFEKALDEVFLEE